VLGPWGLMLLYVDVCMDMDKDSMELGMGMEKAGTLLLSRVGR
jgi:hypothetical protein